MELSKKVKVALDETRTHMSSAIAYDLPNNAKPPQSRFRTDGPRVPADANWFEGLVFH
jgi:hypothetical protein